MGGKLNDESYWLSIVWEIFIAAVAEAYSLTTFTKCNLSVIQVAAYQFLQPALNSRTTRQNTKQIKPFNNLDNSGRS